MVLAALVELDPQVEQEAQVVLVQLEAQVEQGELVALVELELLAALVELVVQEVNCCLVYDDTSIKVKRIKYKHNMASLNTIKVKINVMNIYNIFSSVKWYITLIGLQELVPLEVQEALVVLGAPVELEELEALVELVALEVNLICIVTVL